MERVRFEYKVLTSLRLSKEEVARLSQACERHYDHAVKALTIPGPGAVLNSARFHLAAEDNPEFAEVEVTHRQLDTLAKAVESPMDGNFDLYLKFKELLGQSNDEHARLNQ